MEFVGYKKRNIYPQSELFNYYIECQLDNYTGKTFFGFSGNSQNIEFLFSSGQVYLNSPHSLFLSSYYPNTLLNVSGNVSGSSYDIYINNSPYCLGLPKNTGYYNYFYVNSLGTNTDLTLQLSGNAPGYSYDPFESYYSGQIIPITITNSGNYPFKIFSGDVINNSNFTLSGVNNIDITGSKVLNLISNNFSPTQQEIPINLYTNFGNIVLNFSASGVPLESGQFYLFFGPDNPTIVSDIINNYIVTVKSETGVTLITKLEYVSGITGEYRKNILRTNSYTGTASGVVVGSGEISSLQTGTITEYNSLISAYESGTGTGYLSKFIIASGDVSGEFEVKTTGLASGLLEFNAAITGTGEFLFQGTIGPAGGFLTATGLSGYGSGLNEFGLYFGFTQSGIGTVFVPYTGSTEITGIFDPSQYETINFVSDLFYYTGQVEKFYLISGFVWATGDRISGQLIGEFGYNFEPGNYTFSKNWTGVGSGLSAIIDSFNPVEYTYSVTGTTGLIGGTFYTGFSVDGCDFQEPYFFTTGIPSQIYNSGGQIVSPLQIFVLTPNNTGEYSGDNSNNINSRTNISRRGITPSGTGYFNQVFQQPFYESGIWTETLSGITGQTITTDTGVIKTITANPYLYSDILSGYFKVSGNYTGYQSFIWNGKVTGNFQDYITVISGINNSVYHTYASSYNFEMLLKTGTYGFFIIPTRTVSNTASPSISFPNNLTVFSTQDSINVPFQLLLDSNDTVNISLSYVDGTAINTVSYLGETTSLTFTDGVAGMQYLNIPLMTSGSNSNSFFGIKIDDVNGGYVSNRSEIVGDTIRININSPTVSLSECPCSGTIPAQATGSAQVTLCNNLLGNQLWNGGNGIWTNTLNLLEPVPDGYNLTFRTTFSGVNDRLILKAYVTDGAPITFFDNNSSLLLNEPYYFNGGFSLPSKTYAVYSEVQGGVLGGINNNNRENWELKFICDVYNDGQNFYTSKECTDIDYTLYIIQSPTIFGMKFSGVNTLIDAQLCGMDACSYNQQITGLSGQIYATWRTQGTDTNQDAIMVNNKAIRQDFTGIDSYYVNIYANNNGVPSAPSSLNIYKYNGGITGVTGGVNESLYVSGGRLVTSSGFYFTGSGLTCPTPAPKIYTELIPNYNLNCLSEYCNLWTGERMVFTKYQPTDCPGGGLSIKDTYTIVNKYNRRTRLTISGTIDDLLQYNGRDTISIFNPGVQSFYVNPGEIGNFVAIDSGACYSWNYSLIYEPV